MPDEYGDTGKVAGAQWATMDTVLPDKALHTQGSLRKGYGDGFVFWFGASPPAGVSRKEWEAIRTERWNMAFGIKERPNGDDQLDNSQENRKSG